MSHTILSNFEFVARPTINKDDPLVQRQQKVLQHLNEQLQMANCLLEGVRYEAFRDAVEVDQLTGLRTKVSVPRKARSWFYSIAGCYFFEVRFGNKPIELQKGKQAITVGEKAKLPEVINLLMAAVKAGELDNLLKNATKPSPKKLIPH